LTGLYAPERAPEVLPAILAFIGMPSPSKQVSP
jgi:hypothetical protein